MNVWVQLQIWLFISVYASNIWHSMLICRWLHWKFTIHVALDEWLDFGVNLIAFYGQFRVQKHLAFYGQFWVQKILHFMANFGWKKNCTFLVPKKLPFSCQWKARQVKKQLYLLFCILVKYFLPLIGSVAISALNCGSWHENFNDSLFACYLHISSI